MSQQITTPKDSTNLPAKPPQGDEESDKGTKTSKDASGGAGEGDDKTKVEKTPEGLTDEIKAYIDGLAKKIRKASFEDGKDKGKQEVQAELDQAKIEADKRAGNFESLYQTEQKKAENLQAQLKDSNLNFRKLRAAIAADIPDPLDHYERLKNLDSDDDLLEDAKKVANSFKRSEGHRDPKVPPTTPDGKGGKYTPASSGERTADDDTAEVAEINSTKMYHSM